MGKKQQAVGAPLGAPTALFCLDAYFAVFSQKFIMI